MRAVQRQVSKCEMAKLPGVDLKRASFANSENERRDMSLTRISKERRYGVISVDERRALDGLEFVQGLVTGSFRRQLHSSES